MRERMKFWCSCTRSYPRPRICWSSLGLESPLPLKRCSFSRWKGGIQHTSLECPLKVFFLTHPAQCCRFLPSYWAWSPSNPLKVWLGVWKWIFVAWSPHWKWDSRVVCTTLLSTSVACMSGRTLWCRCDTNVNQSKSRFSNICWGFYNYSLISWGENSDVIKLAACCREANETSRRWRTQVSL